MASAAGTLQLLPHEARPSTPLNIVMRRSNQPTLTRPAAARPPARTATAGPPQALTGWDSVRQWAADNGLDSAEAVRQWINEMAPRGLYSGIDPRAAALLQTLQQFSIASSPGQPAHEIQGLPSAYGKFLEALSSPRVGSTTSQARGRYYPPGIDGPEWIRPLVDPLAEGGRLWPPSPVTALVRMNEVAHRVFGYDPVDSDTMIFTMATNNWTRGAPDVADRVAEVLTFFGDGINNVLWNLGGVRADPTAPKLASDADIAEARQRWPAVSPYGDVQAPYIFVIGTGAPGHLYGQTPITGPTHVALITQGPLIIGRLIVSDATGDVIYTSGVFLPRDPSVYMPAGGLWLDKTSGGNPQLLVDLMLPFIRAVRDGRPNAVSMSSTGITRGHRLSYDHEGVTGPYVVRAFEPAEVLAALSVGRRAAAAEAIDEATASASAGGLASLAARAYRGNIATANVPDEVRQLIAAQAMARACGPGATPQDRARVADAARVLGVPDAVRRQDLATICDASADAVRRLYGRP
ncbi:hypothetical protein TW95_gp0205 [Pandoravirus inopinatum]|uniref:Uncharacterized protein n=1 Tax=Pandoravirus inopinatum TaxID=1605721 RepID=A0A0B5J0E8_9VIRU|nr:hypothetical protein TW95_gp0205 [Pandoravirus inopinatum]AJF96939.1 hypothetical protein [Pandoravirus inopinatum]